MAKIIDDTNTRNAKDVLQILEQNLADIEIEKLNEVAKKLPAELRNIVDDASAHIKLRKDFGAKTASLIMTHGDAHPDVIKKRKALQEYSQETETVQKQAINILESYISGKPLPQIQQAPAQPRLQIPQATPQQTPPADLEKLLKERLKDTEGEMNVQVQIFKEKIGELGSSAAREFTRIQKALNEFDQTIKLIEGYNSPALNKTLSETKKKLEVIAKAAENFPPDYTQKLNDLFEKFASLPKGADVDELLQKYIKIETAVDGMHSKLETASQTLAAYEKKVDEFRKALDGIAETYQIITDFKISKEEVQLLRAGAYNLEKTFSDINGFVNQMSGRRDEIARLFADLGIIVREIEEKTGVTATPEQVEGVLSELRQPKTGETKDATHQPKTKIGKDQFEKLAISVEDLLACPKIHVDDDNCEFDAYKHGKDYCTIIGGVPVKLKSIPRVLATIAFEEAEKPKPQIPIIKEQRDSKGMIALENSLPLETYYNPGDDSFYKLSPVNSKLEQVSTNNPLFERLKKDPKYVAHIKSKTEGTKPSTLEPELSAGPKRYLYTKIQYAPGHFGKKAYVISGENAPTMKVYVHPNTNGKFSCKIKDKEYKFNLLGSDKNVIPVKNEDIDPKVLATIIKV